MNINPFDFLKNAQRIQEQMGEVNAKIASIRVTGSSGGGMVTVELNGRMEALGCGISQEALDLQDRRLLEDLVTSAITDAAAKMREAVAKEMTSMTGGVNLQGLAGMFPGFGGPGAS